MVLELLISILRDLIFGFHYGCYIMELGYEFEGVNYIFHKLIVSVCVGVFKLKMRFVFGEL